MMETLNDDNLCTNLSEGTGTGCPVTSKYGRTPPKKYGGVVRQQEQQQHLVIDGETCGCVKSFCYLGDILDGDGGAELASTANKWWMKFQTLLPFLICRVCPPEMKSRVYASCVGTSMIYGSETRLLAR